GVCTTTVWLRPSLEANVSWIATNAGEVIAGGLSAPPAPIVKLAGTRMLVPPVGDGALRVEDVPLGRVGVDDEPAALELVPAPPTGAGLLVLELPLLCEEPPHAPTSRKTGNRTRTDRRQL